MLVSWLALLALAVASCDAFAPGSVLGLRAGLPGRAAQAAKSMGRVRMSTAVATGGNSNDDEQAGEAAVPNRPWPAMSAREKNYFLKEDEVAVRFINSPGRSPSTGENDIIASAKPGEVLIHVADSVGVTLPRGCMTGLCGACTCDLEDPSWPNARATLRACSAKVVVLEGCDEMVIDVYRMLESKGKPKQDPMARFNSLDDPNVGFKARWNMPEEGAASKSDCAACGAKGVDGKGMMPEDCVLGKGCPFSKF